MINEVQKLISEDQTEQAIGILLPFSDPAKLLQARYNAGKKQYKMGLIEFNEWKHAQAQINFSLIEIANGLTETNQEPSLNISEVEQLRSENERLRTFIEDIAHPRRGTTAEKWTIEDAAIEAEKILKQC